MSRKYAIKIRYWGQWYIGEKKFDTASEAEEWAIVNLPHKGDGTLTWAIETVRP